MADRKGNHRTATSQSQRQLRVGEEMRHAISSILMRGELHDPDLENTSVTVSEVRISPDLKNATAFFMPLGGANRETISEALERAAPEIRKLVASMMMLRYAPRISFKLDYSFDEAKKIDDLLRQPSVARDLKAAE